MISVDVAWRMQRIPNYSQVVEERYKAEVLVEILRFNGERYAQMPATPEEVAIGRERILETLRSLNGLEASALQLRLAGYTYQEIADRWKGEGFGAGRAEYARQYVCRAYKKLDHAFEHALD